MAEMSMVERVGRAIAEANQEDYMEFAALHDAMARAAIDAMREPTREMLAAGKRASCADDIYLTVDEVDTIHRAMITAALNEEAAG